MRFVTAGSLAALPGALTELQPLVQTSEDSMLINVGEVQFMPKPTELLANFVSEHRQITVAGRISGEASSAFPDGPPDATDEPEIPGEETPEDTPEEPSDHLAESVGPINVIVVADVDMLGDQWWVREERIGPISLGYRKTSDNGDFTVNAVENLLGGEELISIRARGKFSRPFDLVEEIRRDAEQRYLDEQRLLESRLQSIQETIDRIQGGDSPVVMLTPELREQLQEAREEQLATKKKLRDVKHDLRKDIERLGTRVKWINTLTIPLVVCLVAVALGLLRARRPGS